MNPHVPSVLKLVAAPLVPARAPVQRAVQASQVLRAPRGGVQLSFQFHRGSDSSREGVVKGLGQG